MSIIHRIARWTAAVGAFRRSESGNYAMLFGLAVIPLMLAIGVAIDLARAYIVQTRLSTALDAAALAAGSAAVSTSQTTAQQQATIRDFASRVFWANYANDFWGGGLDSSGLQFTFSTDGNTISIAARAVMPTVIMGLVGQNSVNVAVSTTAQRRVQGMELVLVLDVTGSMRTSPPRNIDALRIAAEDLVNIVFGTDQSGNQLDTATNLFVGLVPYTATVNINRGRQVTTTPAPDSVMSPSNPPAAADLNAGRVRPQPSSTTPRTGMLGTSNGLARLYTDDLTAGHRAASRTAWLTAAGRNFINGTGCVTPVLNTSNNQLECMHPDGTTLRDDHYPSYYDEWQGCILERWGTNGAMGRDVTDDPPSVQAFTPYAYPLRNDGVTERQASGCEDPDRTGSETVCFDNAYFRSSGSPYNHLSDRSSGVAIDFRIHADSQNWSAGPNLGCPNLAIQPMVNDRRILVNEIRNIQPWHRGGTMTNVGLVWGWRVISPNWQGQWDNGTQSWTFHGSTYPLPLAYDTAQQLGMRKVVVIMTDGVNQAYDWIDEGIRGGGCANGDGPCTTGHTIYSLGADYGAYGRVQYNPLLGTSAQPNNNYGIRVGIGATARQNARNELDRRMTAICNAMRAPSPGPNITIYTITFGGSPDAAAQTLFRNCASLNQNGQPNYFNAPTQADLIAAFQAIGRELSNLRISQ